MLNIRLRQLCYHVTRIKDKLDGSDLKDGGIVDEKSHNGMLKQANSFSMENIRTNGEDEDDDGEIGVDEKVATKNLLKSTNPVFDERR